MITFWLIFSFFLVTSYVLSVGFLAFIWFNTPDSFIPEYKISKKLSVLIAVRNEANNILNLLQDLEKQYFNNFEVLVINDHSEDNTVQILEQFKTKTHLDLKILHSQKVGKKSAIELGISQASGELIITTDGDCRVGEKWLKTIHHFYLKNNAKFISSGVTFLDDNTVFQKIQTVEFASLVGTGAVCMLLRLPNMCNGANLAYPKQVFYEVQGFAGNEHLASGDDEFLMHKIFANYPKQVFFLKNSDAVVRTEAQPSLWAFFQQRKRWASKWKHYKDLKISLLAIYVFLLHFALLFNFGLMCANEISVQIFLLQIFLKFGVEWIFLGFILSFLKQSNKIIFIPLVQIIYPIYVFIFGLAANLGGYEWKNRKMN